MRKSPKLIAGAVAAFLVSAVAGATVFRHSAPVTRAFTLVDAPIQAVQDMFVPDARQLFGKDHLRVLVLGLDYDYDQLDQETSKSARSDVIMALNLDFKNHRFYEISIPRDMVATMPDGRRAKINQAQSDGGVKESKSVIADWLGIPKFDRYVIMRINTSKDLINAIGGVDVNVQNSDALRHSGPNGPLDYDDNWGHLHVHLKPGLQHLDGDHAVGYARFRHDWCSDPCRILRQQQVMHALVDKMTHDKFNTFSHFQQLIAVARKDIDTDFTAQEELSAAMAFSHATSADIHTAQVPYIGDVVLPDYGDCILPDEKARQQLVTSMLDQPIETADANASPDASPQVGSGIRVRVENGTSVPGLAAKVADSLRRKGFTIASVGNAPEHDLAVTVIRSGSAQSDASTRVRAALGQFAAAAHISTDEDALGNSSSDVTVVVGRDIVDANQ